MIDPDFDSDPDPNGLPLTHVSRPPEDGGPGPAPAVLVRQGRGADEHDLLGLVEGLGSRRGSTS